MREFVYKKLKKMKKEEIEGIGEVRRKIIKMSCDYCNKEEKCEEYLGFELCERCSKELNERKQQWTNGTRRVYIYLRVSTQRQSEEETSGMFIQRRQCIEYCFDNNLECRGIYEDIHSAWNMRSGGLEGLHEMIRESGFEIFNPRECKSKTETMRKICKAIKTTNEMLLIEREEEREIDFIVVANIDRFGRDIKNMIGLKKQLEARGIYILSACQTIRTGTDLGDMRFMKEALEAEMFSRDRSMRIKAVKKAKRAMGNFIGGRARYGMTVIRENNIRKQTKCEQEQKVIQRILNLYGKRMGISKIAERLNNANCTKRGKEWTPSMVRTIINRVNDDLEVNMNRMNIE